VTVTKTRSLFNRSGVTCSHSKVLYYLSGVNCKAIVARGDTENNLAHIVSWGTTGHITWMPRKANDVGRSTFFVFIANML
jgi:hypothetical protein